MQLKLSAQLILFFFFILRRHALPGSGDEGTGSRGELRDQAGAGGGEAAVQHGQRESGESTRHHQRAAATEGEMAAHSLCGSYKQTPRANITPMQEDYLSRQRRLISLYFCFFTENHF